MSASNQRARFYPGDHLKGRRPVCGVPTFAHHGIYVGDNQVIDFGNWNEVRLVSVSDFKANSVTVEVVRHGRTTLATGHLWSAVEPREIVARAQFLLGMSPLPQRYNPVGFNCEHVANWCAAGGYCESHQTRAIFAVKAYAGIPFYIWMSKRIESGSDMFWVAMLWTVAGVALRAVYNHEIKNFYSWAQPAWEAWKLDHPAGESQCVAERTYTRRPRA